VEAAALEPAPISRARRTPAVDVGTTTTKSSGGARALRTCSANSSVRPSLGYLGSSCSAARRRAGRPPDRRRDMANQDRARRPVRPRLRFRGAVLAGARAVARRLLGGVLRCHARRITAGELRLQIATIDAHGPLRALPRSPRRRSSGLDRSRGVDAVHGHLWAGPRSSVRPMCSPVTATTRMRGRRSAPMIGRVDRSRLRAGDAGQRRRIYETVQPRRDPCDRADHRRWRAPRPVQGAPARPARPRTSCALTSAAPPRRSSPSASTRVDHRAGWNELDAIGLVPCVEHELAQRNPRR